MGCDIAKGRLQRCKVGGFGGEIQVGYLRREIMDFCGEGFEGGSDVDTGLARGTEEGEKHLFFNGEG